MKTLEARIARDLKAGQATPGALAERLRVKTEAVEVVLRKMAEAGEVDTKEICGGSLTVYYLTKSKREVASD